MMMTVFRERKKYQSLKKYHLVKNISLGLLDLDLDRAPVSSVQLRRLVNAGHHLCHEGPQLRLLEVGRLHDLLVIGLLVGVLLEDALVGDQGEGEDAHLAVAGHQHLRDGAHA